MTGTRRRMAAAAAVAVLPLVGAALAAVPAQAAPAAAGKVDRTYVATAPTKVKTSSKKKLEVSVYGTKDKKTSSLSVRVGTRNGVESHTWDFKLPKKAIKLNKAGKGKIVSGSKLGPFGKLTLRVVPVGKTKTTKCGGVTVGKYRRAVVAGKFYFNTKTGAKKWGAIGSKKRSFTFSKASTIGWSYDLPDDVDLNCGGDQSDYCPTGVGWSYFGNGVSLYGNERGARFELNAGRSVDLSKPKHATRYDSVTVKTAKPQLVTDAENNATMKVFGSTGSATLTSQYAGFPTDVDCGTKKQTREFWSATVTNDSTPLRVKAQVFGGFSMPDSTGSDYTGASFDRTTNK